MFAKAGNRNSRENLAHRSYRWTAKRVEYPKGRVASENDERIKSSLSQNVTNDLASSFGDLGGAIFGALGQFEDLPPLG